MGESTDADNAELGINREAQDAFGAARTSAPPPRRRTACSPRRSPGADPAAQGGPVRVTADEGIRADTTAEPCQAASGVPKDGTITAGTSSPISDGACAVVVMSKAKAEELGLTWLAEIGAHGNVAGPDTSLHSQPANAIKTRWARRA